MGGDSPAELVRKHLVVDESVIFERVIERAKKIIVLDSKGEVHLVGSKDRFSARQLFLVLLLGRRLAVAGELADSDAADTRALSAFLNASQDVVSARASDLKREGLIEPVTRGSWRILPHRIEEVLSDLEGAPRGSRP